MSFLLSGFPFYVALLMHLSSMRPASPSPAKTKLPEMEILPIELAKYRHMIGLSIAGRGCIAKVNWTTALPLVPF